MVAILSHRDTPLLQRLVHRVLDGERTAVLVHHDPRSGPDGLDADDRVLRVREARSADWGMPSLAQAVLRCVTEATEQVPDLDWLLLISGQDYPTRGMAAIEADLAATDADAYLRHFQVPSDPSQDVHPWQARCRARYLGRRRIPLSHRSIPMPRRSPFRDGTELYIGDMWVNLKHTAVRHLIDARTRHADIERYLYTCSVPDEAVVPSLLLNGSPGLRIENDRRRFIRWSEGAPHPEILTLPDLDAVTTSTDWFARKVDSVRSAELLDALDARASSTPT